MRIEAELMLEKTVVLFHDLEVITLLKHRKNHGWVSLIDLQNAHKPNIKTKRQSRNSTSDHDWTSPIPIAKKRLTPSFRW